VPLSCPAEASVGISVGSHRRGPGHAWRARSVPKTLSRFGSPSRPSSSPRPSQLDGGGPYTAPQLLALHLGRSRRPVLAAAVQVSVAKMTNVRPAIRHRQAGPDGAQPRVTCNPRRSGTSNNRGKGRKGGNGAVLTYDLHRGNPRAAICQALTGISASLISAAPGREFRYAFASSRVSNACPAGSSRRRRVRRTVRYLNGRAWSF